MGDPEVGDVPRAQTAVGGNVSPTRRCGGGIKKISKTLKQALSQDHRLKRDAKALEEARWQPDAETGKITVDVSELDFVGARYTHELFQKRHFDVAPGSEDEHEMLAALRNILNILRSNGIQRSLVRKKLFHDDDIPRKPHHRVERRPLAGSLRDYVQLCSGPGSREGVAFKECVIELLAIYLLGSCRDVTQEYNDPRKLDYEMLGEMRRLQREGFPVRAEETRPGQAEGAQLPRPMDKEITFAIKVGAVQVIDEAIRDRSIGVDQFCALGPPTATLSWALELYRLCMSHDEEVRVYALRRGMVRLTWEVVARKMGMREAAQDRIAKVKLSCCDILNELGKMSIDDTDDQTEEGRMSINMVNMNSRSTKEITKLLHNHPHYHPLILSLLTLLGQKAVNNTHLKEQGMMEYLTTKVLPFHSEHHQKCIPHLVILLNSWMVHPEDLDFFWQFNGIQCLVFHMENALSGDKVASGDDDTNWEDMILHGLSILYKLSDNPVFHQKMMEAQVVMVLLEATRQVDPLKSMYHLNAHIGGLYCLRNLTACSIDNRIAVVRDPHFLILPHLLGATMLPTNCLTHILFLLSNLVQEADDEGRSSDKYRNIIMEDIFLQFFKPLCVIVQSTPLRKVLDDAQITILCLSLQLLATLVSIAKQENPLLCIQIEHDLPLQHLNTFAAANTPTPYPQLANELLSLVYLVP